MPAHTVCFGIMTCVGIIINRLWPGILLAKRCGNSNCLLLAEAGSCGWLLRIHQAAEGQCVETWTKPRVFNNKPLHNFTEGKHKDVLCWRQSSLCLLSLSLISVILGAFSLCIKVKVSICRLLFLMKLKRSLLVKFPRSLTALDKVGSSKCSSSFPINQIYQNRPSWTMCKNESCVFFWVMTGLNSGINAERVDWGAHAAQGSTSPPWSDDVSVGFVDLQLTVLRRRHTSNSNLTWCGLW